MEFTHPVFFSFPFFPVEICDYVDISEDSDIVRYLSYFFNPEIVKLS